MWPRSVPRLLVAALAIFSISLIYSACALFSLRTPPISLEEKVERFQIDEGNQFHRFDHHPKNFKLEKNLKLENVTSKFIEISPGNFAFTAIADARDGNMGKPQVRILMVIMMPSDFACQFFDDSVIPGKLYEFSENHKKQEKVFYLNCQLPPNIDLNSIEEITVLHKSAKKSARVPITYRIEDEHSISLRQTFAICVPFIFGDKYSAKHFVEFMEMNRMLGVDQISIYSSDSLGADLKRVMSEYVKEGLLEIVPFSLPFYTEAIWYYGQLLTITDCLLRHTGRTEFVAFHDLDEFVIPKSEILDEPPPNRLTLLPKLFSNKNIGSLRLKTYYFSPDKSEPPITINNVHRMDFIDTRFTKCILRPHYTFEQGIHHTSRVIQDNYTSDHGDEKRLALFHYKKKGPTSIEDKYFPDNFSNFSQIYTQKCQGFNL